MIKNYIHAETLIRKEQSEDDFVEPEHILDSGITLLSLAQWHQNIIDTTCLPENISFQITTESRDFVQFSVSIFDENKLIKRIGWLDFMNYKKPESKMEEPKAIEALKEIEQYLRDGKF
jgi:hypothetical protein